MGRRDERGGRPEGDDGARSGEAETRLAPGGADASEAEGNHREAVTYSLTAQLFFVQRRHGAI